MTEPLLQVRDIAKSFGGVPALRGIDVAVRAGEIHALLGQNGAGKSTLVKILNGVHPAGSFTGEIVLAGQPVSFASPADAAAAGIVYVPQEIEVLEQLTVAENVFAGRTGLGDGFLVNRRALRGAHPRDLRRPRPADGPARHRRLAHLRPAPPGDDRPRPLATARAC